MTRRGEILICPPELRERMTICPVVFRSFRGDLERGEIIVDRDLRDDIAALFLLMREHGFPLRSVIPISDPRFHGNDSLSMAANNTSGFNYRFIAGTKKLSNHATGRAIDLNPLQNPFVKNGTVDPPGAIYDPAAPGTIVADSFIVRFMEERGWRWGGRWRDRKDYQHFEKPPDGA